MRSKSFLSSLALAAALAVPAVSFTVPALQAQVGVQIKIGRVYDRDRKHYHNWDDREDRAYRGYLVENHQTYRPYAKQRQTDQRRYWNWRHEHPDHN